MAELTKQALKVQNNTEFPNNNAGLITPTKLRGFNVDMIDSLVDEISYNVDSASWNQQIDSLENFTASFNTSSLVSSASFNAYTSSNNQRVTSLEANSASVNISIANLNAYTASDDTSISNLEAFTASAAVSISNLNQSSASQQVSINALNVFTASQSTASIVTSITNLNSATASLFTSASLGLTTASLSGQILTFTKGDNNTFAITIPDVSGSDISALNQATASLQSFTASAAISITNLNASSASQQVSIDALNTFTASQSTASLVTSINNLNTFSASALTSLSNLNSATASLNTSASLALVTASFDNGTRNLTFTKGDTQTFSVNIPDISGSAGNFVTTSSFNAYTQSNDQKVDSLIAATGSYATTGSNTFTGNQTISSSAGGGDYIINAAGTAGTVTYGQTGAGNFQISQSGSVTMRGTNSTAFEIYATASFIAAPSIPNITSDLKVDGNFTASLQQGYAWVGNASGVSTTVPTSSFGGGSVPAGTISGSAQITALGFVSSSITASSLITASATGANITFTKGDGSQFTITTATGSVASASYAETASLAINAKDIIVDVKNTTGAQINKGTVVRIIGATGDNALIGTASWEDDNNSANTLGFVVTDIPNDTFGRVMTQGTLLSVNTDPALGYAAGDLVYLSSSGQFTKVIPPVPYHEVRLGQVLRAQQNNGSIYVLIQNGYELSELHDVDINTGSLATNNLLAYNSASGQWENKTLNQVGAATTGSNSFNGNQIITGSFTASLANGFTYVGNSSGVTVAVATSSIAGTTYTNPTLNPFSGSLILVANTFTSSSFAHISASANGQVNLVFKNNDNTATTIISGSGNIFTNTGNPTAGFRRYLTSGNISLAGALPQISASMQFSPTISNNTFLNTTATGNPITIRGPISSSAYSITGNYINNALNIGSSAANNAEKIVAGLSVGNSIIQTLSIVANKTNTTQGSSILNNQFQGTSTLNMNSSSIDVNNNLWYGTNTITNNSSGSSRVSVFGNAVGLYQNIMLGSNTVTFSGSNDPNDVQDLDYNGGVFRSMIIGTNTPFVLTGPTGSNSISNTGIIGNGLIVTGSSGNPVFSGITTGHGSLFTGRFNAEGTKNRSAENVFVVGTGTSTSARKTGFLIDSGSNTFIEGTLNVSGASALNGDLVITGSLILSSSAALELQVIGNSVFTGSVAGNVVSASITSNTASIDFSLANYFEVTSSVTPLHLNVTNITPGRTSTLIISASASSSILFSPNVAQPSGSAYSGSAGSIDIISLVAFNTSKVNLVSTKALV